MHKDHIISFLQERYHKYTPFDTDFSQNSLCDIPLNHLTGADSGNHGQMHCQMVSKLSSLKVSNYCGFPSHVSGMIAINV